MGTSPDVGGRAGLGRPLEPLPQEQEATAQTQVARQGLGLVPNSIDVSFTQLGGEIYKYESNPARPKLQMNVLVAPSHPEKPQVDKRLETTYQQLFKGLPLKLQLALEQEMKKPKKDRDPIYVVYHQILQFIASALVWLQDVSEITPEKFNENNNKNAAFPYLILRGWNQQAKSVLKTLDVLQKKDLISSVVLNDNKEMIQPLSLKLETLLDTKQEDAKQLLQDLLEEALLVEKRLKKKQFPNALPLIETFLDTLVKGLYILTYENKAPAFYPFSLGSEQLATKHINGYLDQVIDNLPDTTLPQQKLLKNVSFVVIMLFNALVVEASGISKETTLNLKKQTQRVQSFAFTLASGLLAKSRFTEILFKKALEKLEIPSDYHNIIEAAVSSIAMTVPIIAGSIGDKTLKAMDPLMEGVSVPLAEKLGTIKKFLAGAKKDPLTLALSNAVRQAAIALNKQEASGYLEAIQGAIKPLKQKLPYIQDESEEIIAFAMVLLNNLYKTSEQEKFTSAVIQAA